MSVAIHLVLAGDPKSPTEFTGPLPDFGYRKPRTIFTCHRGNLNPAITLKELIDASDGGCTDIKFFDSAESFSIPTYYDYVVIAGDSSSLLKIFSKVAGDSLWCEEVERALNFTKGNMVSIHFSLTGQYRNVRVTTGTINETHT